MRSSPWLALLGPALLACHTGERLWRITPFEGGAASDRVNLWPLAYHSGNETSVLWPLFDLDERGFALRPLMAKDGTGYSILWPLASFDTEPGTGWVGPFYKFESVAGLFPLANFGSLSWVGPVWWTDDSSGLFPLARFGGTSYVGPVWWSGEGEGGLFPLATFGPTSYVGPAWWTTDGSSYGCFPLFGVNLFGQGIDHVGPVWWRPDAETFAGGLWPLLSYADGGQRFTLLPLYSHALGPEARTRNFLLGLGHLGRTGTSRERWFLPLYYHRSEPERADTVLLPFFWKRTRGERADVYTLLGNRSVDPQSRTLNLYPVWWSNESTRDDSAWRMLFPLFFFERDGDERTLITPLGGRGWSRSGETAFVNFLGPLYHHSRSLRRDETRTAFLWPLFERHRRGAERTTRLAGLYEETRTPEETERSYAFWLGHGLRTPTGSSHRFWPLYSWSEDEELPGPVYRWTLFGWRSRGDTTNLRLFPLLWREASPRRTAWEALLGLVHHEEAGEGLRPSERSWVWPLYARSRNAGDPGFAERTALLGTTRWEGGWHFQLGASLLYSGWAEESAEVERRSSRALLFYHHEQEERRGPHVPAPGRTAAANRVQHESHGFLFDAFVSRRSTYHTWREGVLDAEEARALRAYVAARPPEGLPERERVRAILAARGAAPAEDEPAALRAAIAAFSDAHTEEVEHRHVRIPLVYGYEHGPDESRWYGPLGLVSYARDAERERFSLFYYGYRRETKGGRTSRDIFPFLTWDSGPDETSWSFLWRLLHYERKGERRGGHVLFFPWGDV